MAERQGDSWLEQRYDFITGTDVGIIMGVASDSRAALLESKVLRKPLHDDSNPFLNNLFESGRLFEPSAKDSFEDWMKRFHFRETGQPIHNVGQVGTLIKHKKSPLYAGTPDYICSLPGLNDSVVEFKTHWMPSAGESVPIEDVKTIPLKYYLQVQHYLELADLPTGMLYSWTFSHGATCFHVRRDPALWAWLAPKLEEFNKYVQDARKYHTPQKPISMHNLKAYKDLVKMKRGQKKINEDTILTSLLWSAEKIKDDFSVTTTAPIHIPKTKKERNLF